MEKEFIELFQTMNASRKKCPWAEKVSIEEAMAFLSSEVKELEAEVKSFSKEEMMDEFGDVLSTAMFFAVIAEEKGFFTISDSLKNAMQKFRRRKPWIFDEKIKIASAEEAVARWNKAKQKEKEEKAAKKASRGKQ